MKTIANFIFETGFLKRVFRSGYAYLGSGKESVADHTCGMLFIAYVLGHFAGEGIDMGRLLKMCLFHDLPETRLGDLNYVNKKYLMADEDKALEDVAGELPFGEELIALLREFNEKQTLEAQLANDADQLDLLFHVKKEADIGNLQTGPWLEFAFSRLITEQARQLARVAMETDSTDWWLSERDVSKII